MNDPIKLIWKYKNNNRRIQYNTYIFIGNLVPHGVQTILNKIVDFKFYDALTKLHKDEHKKLVNFYGEYWYLKFFNVYHVNSSIIIIKDSPTQRNELINMFGKDWYNKHITSRKLVEKKIIYSYESLIKDDKNRKATKKGRTMAIGDDDGDLDFTLSKKIDINKLYAKSLQSREISEVSEINKVKDNSDDALTTSDYELSDSSDDMMIGGNVNNSELNSYEIDNEYEFRIGQLNNLNKLYNEDDSNMLMQSGGYDDFEENDNDEDNVDGFDESEDLDNLDNLDDIDDVDYDNTKSESFDEDEENENTNETTTGAFMVDEEVDLDEIEQLYKEADVNEDKHLAETTNLIKKALNDDKLFDKKLKHMVDFDQSRNESMYDDNLKDVYKKYYVKSQYIYKDDTIKIMRDKICCGIKCNPALSNDLYLTPSRQYFWSEYTFDEKINKVMIGQKWLRRNELLNIDVEPMNNFRVYEDLRGPLKSLRENIRRYNNKIRREDDDNDILYDYDQFISGNEIYMVDLYNELGKNYSADTDVIKNLQDIYLKIYFPRIKSDDVKSIIDMLNGNKTSEVNKSLLTFDTINNDLTIENEITNTVEEVKMKEKYQHLFKENYVTQSVIHLNLRLIEGSKLSLFRVFNEFTVNETYPFVQYQSPDGNIVYKFNEEQIDSYVKQKDNTNVLMKWFENAPYGISFKFRVHDKTGMKFMAIVLNENGRIEYKTQWKEDDMATIDDIKNTYSYVKELITKINSENNKITIDMPDDGEFKFAFINTIQKYALPSNFIVNHNNLSNFSRYFYPYVALVIEPRKRQAKVPKGNDTSKYGTYFRYKRVSKYENQARIEQRIMYFIRNFEFTEKALANEISKQFNITEEKAIEEYEKVKQRYPNIKKSRKVLKKLENIPKYKPQGIGIDIQGKQRENYKIRISGARDKAQLDRIITFLNVLIYLYVETYHYKTPERQILKKKLEFLKNIAERRHKVDDFVKHQQETKTVKQMTAVDKRRIGFKPEKGQNQWTRSCQNSGNDKKRRPQQYNSTNMDTLLKKGYHINKKTGNYERRIIVKEKGKKVEKTLSTVKLPEFDEEGNLSGNEIHYSCDPSENGDHFYVGFLTRSTNPFGHCMPCCFKKDHLSSKNKEKQELFKKCLGQTIVAEKPDGQKVVGDRLYILQDTNKIQEGRFGFLPKYLDIYFNYALDKSKKIKNHYLMKTDTGYFFKYGSKQDDNQFMNAMASIFDMTAPELENVVISFLEKDKRDQIFTSLNSGDIKTYFRTRETYMNYIKNTSNLGFGMCNDILSVPGVLTKNGLNMVIFEKRVIVTKKTFEKEKIREDFVLHCQNSEDIYGLKNPNKDCIFLVKENKHYYPVVMVFKDVESSKSMDVTKTFTFGTDNDNIVNHISDYYQKNCTNSFMDTVVYKNSSLYAKLMAHYLSKLSKDYHVKYQFIDIRNKCKYLITTSNILVPVRPSGSIHDIQIIKSIDKYLSDFSTTINTLETISKESNDKIPIKPIGVYYDDGNKTSVNVNAIVIKTHDIVPVIISNVKISKLEEMGLTYENKPFVDKVDAEILKGKENHVIDERIKEVNFDKYKDESYELFRLEFSSYINKNENSSIKRKLENVMIDGNLSKKTKSDKIKLLIYRLFDKSLYSQYKTIVKSSVGQFNKVSFDEDDDDNFDNDEIEQDGGKHDRLITLISKLPVLTNYSISNDRALCEIHDGKDKCNINNHCHWTHSGCKMGLIHEMAIFFVNKMSEELAQNELKAIELMQVEGYFVSDIVDHTRFTERSGQKIVKSTSNTIKKVLNDTFGKDTSQIKIGRRKTIKGEINYQQLNENNPIIDFRTFYIQRIINNNLSMFRAYVNGYYWLKNKYNDIESKNLGYYSTLQTDLANYFRSFIIDWLGDSANIKKVMKDLKEYFDVRKGSKNPIKDFIIKLAKDVPVMTNCVIELHVLSKINRIPIVVYDDQNVPLYIFDKGLVYNSLNDNKIPESYEKYVKTDMRNIINLRFLYISETYVPETVETMYFK
jgi:hypothetical protein